MRRPNGHLGVFGTITPLLRMGRNSGPDSIPDTSSYSSTALTGQVIGCEPYGIPTVRPVQSWSVFDLRSVTTIPSCTISRSSTSRKTSSDRKGAGKPQEDERSIAATPNVVG